MTKKGRPTRPGGEFYRPVECPEPVRGIDKYIAEITGEAYRADRPTQVKRELFLREVEKLEPEVKAEHGAGVLGSLYDGVLPLYQADDRSGYEAALDNWLGRWNINAPWVRDAALRTLEDWEEGWAAPGDYRDNDLEWQMPLGESDGYWASDTITTKELLRGSPTHFVYDPTGTDLTTVRAQFAASQERQRHHFEAFIDAQNRKAESAGGVRTKELREPAHLEWAVRWQVLGWRRKKLEAHYHRGWPSIRDAINETLEQIELPRVKGAPGRPRRT